MDRQGEKNLYFFIIAFRIFSLNAFDNDAVASVA